MGRAITYCVQCSKRVTEADLESGKAFRVGDRILCRDCAPESARVQTTQKVHKPHELGTSAALKAQPQPPSEEPPDLRKKTLLIGGGAAAVAVVLLVAVLALRGGPAPHADRSPEHPTPDPSPSVLPVDSKEASAKADLDKARAFAKAHSDDPAACMKQFDDIVWRWEGTIAGAEAAKEAAAIKAANLEKVKAWMAEAEATLRPLVEKGEFRAAAARLEELKPTRPLVEWRLAVESRVSELRLEAVKVEDQRKAEADKAAAVATPKSEDKPLSEEARGYPAKWEAAAARATARDFAGATAELQRVAAGLKEGDVRAEAAQDAKDLKALAALYTSSMDALKKKPRGAAVRLDVRQPGGETRRLVGVIQQIDAQRVEILSGKGSAFVEWEDVASSTLAGDPKAGARIRAELCLLDGEVEAAKALEADLSPKWWTYGAGARARVPRPDPAEKGARDAFYAAEQGYRSTETRAAAIEAYRTLRGDYGSSSVAKAYGERIARRAEAGKEYYFAPADFLVEGTFKLAKSGKVESGKDTDEAETLHNAAEIEFAALPNVPYRCWILAGACCEETFAFYLQGTEVTDIDPKTKKKTACEPGTSLAALVRNSIRGLKKTHAEHRPKGAKEHPKTAARWEWIEIPLPKYASPGRKRLRFMTSQAGFSIGGAVVSSSRKMPPKESDLNDLEKDRESPDAPLLDPDLVAWWTFDDGGGSVALDVTGKGHDARVVGAVKWTEGRTGGGVRFTANGTALRVDDAEDLRIPGDLTLALWMKKEGDAGEWCCLLGKGEKLQRNYGLWLEAHTRLIMFQSYGQPVWSNVKGKKPVPDNVWTHLAASCEGTKVRIYINGVLDTEQERKLPAQIGAFPAGIGWASDHATFRGILDDVRIYRRALSGDEIRAMTEQAR
jgi:hypothetical protein